MPVLMRCLTRLVSRQEDIGVLLCPGTPRSCPKGPANVLAPRGWRPFARGHSTSLQIPTTAPAGIHGSSSSRLATNTVTSSSPGCTRVRQLAMRRRLHQADLTLHPPTEPAPQPGFRPRGHTSRVVTAATTWALAFTSNTGTFISWTLMVTAMKSRRLGPEGSPSPRDSSPRCLPRTQPAPLLRVRSLFWSPLGLVVRCNVLRHHTDIRPPQEDSLSTSRPTSRTSSSTPSLP